MYVVLDTKLKRLATLDTKTDTNIFWGDTIERQIADDNSSSDEIAGVDTFNSTDPNANSKSWNDTIDGLTMLADSPAAGYLREGNHLAVYDESTDRWRVYRIHTVTESIDSTSGSHTVSVAAVNLAIWKLGKTIPLKKEIKDCKLKNAMEWIMADTGWELDNNSTTGLFSDISFDGATSSQAMLQTILTTYDCEADAYVTFDSSGLVDDLILELCDQVGEETHDTISYGNNAMNITRETVDTTLVTKLYVYGADGKSIGDVNNGHNFVTDTTANALYNSDKNTWLEGTITSNTITEPKALLAWGLKQLRLFNHPRINYTVEPTSDFQPNLGDTVRVVDLTMYPVLTVQARVISKTTSFSDPGQNKITLGEFATVTVVTPSFIKNMEQRWSDHVKKLFADARKNANAATVSLITPLGTSWSNSDTVKKITARLFIEGENVTSFLSAAAFNWQKINTDGTHDIDWEQEHQKDGYEVTIVPPFVGTLMVSIDDAFVKDEAEIWIDMDSQQSGSAFKKIWESKESLDSFGNTHIGGLQYAYHLSDGSVLASYAYNKKGAKYSSSLSDSEFIKYNSNGVVTGAMIVQGGTHAGAFGYDENTNTIYSQIRQNTSKGYTAELCSFPFQVGAHIAYGDSSVTKFVDVKEYLRVSVDVDNDVWLGSNTSGEVKICKLSELKGGDFKPIVEFNLKDFGITPLPTGVINDGSYNTLQAHGIYYPYAFFTTGDVNNADPRIILGVNVITHSAVFNYQPAPMQDIPVSIPVEDGGHFEPEGIYYDKSQSKLIVGFNVSEWKDASNNTAVAHSALYEVPIGWRDDSKDFAVEYPLEDTSLIDVEEPTTINQDSKGAADIEDDENTSDMDDDFDATDPTGTEDIFEP